MVKVEGWDPQQLTFVSQRLIPRRFCGDTASPPMLFQEVASKLFLAPDMYMFQTLMLQSLLQVVLERVWVPKHLLTGCLEH